MTSRTLPLLALLACTACVESQPTTRAPERQSGSPEVARASVPVAAAVDESEWWTGDKPCPDGAELKGAAPPRGNAVSCEQGGQVHGTKTTFHPNGQRARSERYYRGRLEGHFTVWHDNGAVAEEGRFHNGLLEGHW